MFENVHLIVTTGYYQPQKCAIVQLDIWTMSLAEFQSNFKIWLRYVCLYFLSYQSNHNDILHIPWQHSCRGMCKISLWFVQSSLSFSDVTFHWISMWLTHHGRDMCLGIFHNVMALIDMIFELVNSLSPERNGNNFKFIILQHILMIGICSISIQWNCP